MRQGGSVQQRPDLSLRRGHGVHQHHGGHCAGNIETPSLEVIAEGLSILSRSAIGSSWTRRWCLRIVETECR